ncbi:hypothetical protein M885DRAFT_587745 [Pelagophyceae sp. CCMP2097]|nr:hypothetical protein M885DRAFT_587745 [Pelagophyceae sp. CCMP2097]
MLAVSDASLLEALDWCRVSCGDGDGGGETTVSHVATCGGGARLACGTMLVWRGHRNALWLCELSTTRDLEHNAIVLALPSPLEDDDSGAVGLFYDDEAASLQVCIATTRHVCRLRVSAEVEGGSVLAGLSFSRRVPPRDWKCEALDSFLSPQQEDREACRCWASPDTVLLGLEDGGALRLSLDDGACRDLRDPTLGLTRRLLSKVIGHAKHAANAVVAVTRCGVDRANDEDDDDAAIVTVRADWLVVVYSAAAPHHVVTTCDCAELLGRGDAGRELVSEATVAWCKPSAAGTLRVAVGFGKGLLVIIDTAVTTRGGGEGTTATPRKRKRATIFGSDSIVKLQDVDPRVDAVLAPPAGDAYDLVALCCHGEALWSSWLLVGAAPDEAGAARTLSHDARASGAVDGVEHETLHSSALRDGSFGDAALERAASAGGGFSAAAGVEGWPAACASLERFFVARLARPGRFSRRAVVNALRYGLPNVLQRRVDDDADAVAEAVAAARAWFALRLRGNGSEELELRCATLADCWRAILRLVAAQAFAANKPLGFVRGTDATLPAPPVVHAAALSLQLPAPDNAWTGALADLAAALRPRDLRFGLAPVSEAANDAARDLARDLSRLRDAADAAVDARVLCGATAPGTCDGDVQTLADGAAAVHVELALGCAEAATAALAKFEGGVDNVRHACACAIDASGLLGGGDAAAARWALSQWATDLYVDAAHYHAAAAYSRVRDVVLALGLARSVELTPQRRLGRAACAALESLLRELALTKWLAQARDDSDPKKRALHGLLFTLAPRSTLDAMQHSAVCGAVVWAASTPTEDAPSALDAYLRSTSQKRHELLRCALCVADASRDDDDSQDEDAWPTANRRYAACADALCAASPQCAADARLVAAAHVAACADVSEGFSMRLDASARTVVAYAPALAAARMRLALDSGGAVSDTARAWLFELALKERNFEDAYSSSVAGRDGDQGRIARLAQRLCEAGELATLIRLPWTQRARGHVDAALEALARRGGVDDTLAVHAENGAKPAVDYYKCLYALRASRGSWVGAARASLEASSRLAPHSNLAKKYARQKLQADAAALVALDMVGDDCGFVATRPKDDDKAGLRLVTAETLTKQLVVDGARLTLQDIADADVRDVTRPHDVAARLVRAGLYEKAVDVLRAHGATAALNGVFSALASKCVEAEDRGPACVVQACDGAAASPLHAPAGAPRTRGIVRRAYSPNSDALWALLRRLLALDSKKTNFAYHAAAARAALEADVEALPQWLADALLDGASDASAGRLFAKRGADPAALLRLYLHFGRTADACDAARRVVANALVDADGRSRALAAREPLADEWLPQAPLDAVLAAASVQLATAPRDADAQALQTAHDRLIGALEEYYRDVAVSLQAANANKALA